jgi:hypothetical protein
LVDLRLDLLKQLQNVAVACVQCRRFGKVDLSPNG